MGAASFVATAVACNDRRYQRAAREERRQRCIAPGTEGSNRLAAGGKWIRTISTWRVSDASFSAFGCVAYLDQHHIRRPRVSVTPEDMARPLGRSDSLGARFHRRGSFSDLPAGRNFCPARKKRFTPVSGLRPLGTIRFFSKSLGGNGSDSRPVPSWLPRQLPSLAAMSGRFCRVEPIDSTSR